jgi:hypothetical protein
MDVIIVCHTEFGYVYNYNVIYEKRSVNGVKNGAKNLIKIANKYRARITFAVMPEVVEYYPADNFHEIGLHVHPGWIQHKNGLFTCYLGDKYLFENCSSSVNSSVLRDYELKDQMNFVQTGRDYLCDKFKVDPKVFVAGRWSENSSTINALVKAGFTHDCSAFAKRKESHFDWSRIPRICMPYNPSANDYQRKGDLPLLIVPVSQLFPSGCVTPEIAPFVGLASLKACFKEYYLQNLPLFHICLHSPSMTDPYFCSVMENLLAFISRYNVNFKFASEVSAYQEVKPKTNILPYLIYFEGGILRLRDSFNRKINVIAR